MKHPKQQAEEILTKYIVLSPNASLVYHRQCALIAVRLIIDVAVEMDDKCKEPFLNDELHWQRVEAELIKL